MATLEEPSFNILWAWRISLDKFSNDERCISSCCLAAVIKVNLFSDDKIISELPKISWQCFVYFLIYSNMSLISRFLLLEFLRILL